MKILLKMGERERPHERHQTGLVIQVFRSCVADISWMNSYINLEIR